MLSCGDKNNSGKNLGMNEQQHSSFEHAVDKERRKYSHRTTVADKTKIRTYTM